VENQAERKLVVCALLLVSVIAVNYLLVTVVDKTKIAKLTKVMVTI
jgi:hypothetical protein